jgi:predicted NBD/HSP70 family sugar kinase
MISRVEIAKVLGLSKASLTGITAELIKEGLILEKQHGAYQVGRRPILLALNPDGVYAVGICLRIKQIQVVIINFQAEKKATYALPLQENYYTPQELVEKIALAVEGCIERSTFSKDQISGVGVSIPGLVDSRSGIIRYLPNYGWSDINLKPMLQDKMGTNIYIDNEANNLTIAEHWFGECVKSDNFIVVLIENGIGAGYVLNGQLVRGNLGIAGEFGHLIINPDGPLCRCGKRGCIEAYSGVYGIMRHVSKISSSEKWNVASKLDSSFQKLIEEVNRGNQDLEKVFDQAGKALGIGLSNLMALLNPEKIIITGKGVQAGKLLFDPMFASIKNGHSGRIGHYDPEILIANWTNEDFAKGAGTLVLQEIYKSPAFEK